MNPHMFFVSLFFSLVGVLPSFGQSVTLHGYVCLQGYDTTGSVPVGPFQEMVSFSAIIPPGTEWNLYSYQNGQAQTLERTLTASVAMDTLVIECAPSDPMAQFNDFGLNLQITRGTETFVSQVFYLSGVLNPPPYDTTCKVIGPLTTGLESEPAAHVAKAWPNPFTETLTIEGPSEFNFCVLDVLGRSILAGRSTGRKAAIGSLPPGKYAVTMDLPKGRETLLVIAE